MMNKAVIALGSNIQPEKNTEIALKNLAEKFSLINKSQFKYTEPIGYKNQPNFLNGAVLIETTLNRPEIEFILKEIEQKIGRKRNGRNDGPRKIDLDLVLYNGRILDNDVHEREFLRQSIQELLPGLTLFQ